jgi:glycosyltransferase involved in cell wall biosynthesis
VHVLHVITGLHAGGAEQQLASLIERTRHDAEVVTMYAAGLMADRIRALSVPVHNLDRRSQLDLRAVADLAALLRRRRYDVVHTHLYRACLYGRVAARIARVPVVVATEHSLGDTQIEGRPTTWPVRTLYLATERLGDHTIAVSGAARDRLIGWGVPDHRISVIPNGLDIGRYAFAPTARHRERAALGIADDEVAIGAVGRLHPIKRLDWLLAASAGVLRTTPARLVIVGGGECDRALRSQAAALGIEHRVHFLGERGDVPSLLSALDVYAAPSAEETFGLAVVEALCAGLPAVVGACPAIDGLDLPQVARVTDPRSLETSLARMVRAARGAPPRPRTPPDAIAAHMDIGRVAEHVDNLYQYVGTSARVGGESSAAA